ncbi:hypothetical protein [Dokdonia ponticola]
MSSILKIKTINKAPPLYKVCAEPVEVGGGCVEVRDTDGGEPVSF